MDIDRLHEIVAARGAVTLEGTPRSDAIWALRLHPHIAENHATDVAEFVLALHGAPRVDRAFLHDHHTVLVDGYVASSVLCEWVQEWWEEHGGTWAPTPPPAAPAAPPRRWWRRRSTPRT